MSRTTKGTALTSAQRDRQSLRDFVRETMAEVAPELAFEVPEGSSPEAVAWQWVHQIAKPPVADEMTVGGAIPDSFRQTLAGKLKTEIARLSETLLCRLEALRPDLHAGYSKQPESFTFVDLFAGVGGMRLGFERAGGRCLFSSEWDQAAQDVYFNNHLEVPFGDITKIPPSFIPRHDVLVGGFPCQPFSHAGKKLGIADTRGTLFHSIAEIADAKQPRFIFLENVRGLIAHDRGRTLYIILRRLEQSGYRLPVTQDAVNAAAQDDFRALKKEAYKLVRYSKDFGVPQLRPRVFLVLANRSAGNVDIPSLYPAGQPNNEVMTVANILRQERDDEFDPADFVISDRLLSGHLTRRIVNTDKKNWGFGCNIIRPSAPYTATLSARYYKDGAEILIDMGDEGIRKITPREAALLQGFPPAFELAKSKVQAYKQFGNSVTVPVVEAFARLIAESIASSGRDE